MAKDLFPNVKFSETDLTTVVRTQSSAIGAMVGRFLKGPIDKPILISDKNTLIDIFGTPSLNGTDFNNLEDWYTVSNFLDYTSGIYVIRVEPTTTTNAGRNFNDDVGNLDANPQIKNGYDMTSEKTVANFGSGANTVGLNLIAKYPGVWGNDISVKLGVISDLNYGLTDTQWDEDYYNYTQVVTLNGVIPDLYAIGTSAPQYLTDELGQTGFVTAVSGGTAITLAHNLTSGGFSATAGTSGMTLGLTSSGTGTKDISSVGTNTYTGYYDFMQLMPDALGTSQIGIVVYGTSGILETHIVSTLPTEKTHDGKAMYVDDYLEQNSKYISSYYYSIGAYGTAAVVSQAGTAIVLAGATSSVESAVTAAMANTAMDENYKDKNNLKIDLILDGRWAGNTTVMNNIISIVEFRDDCFGILGAGTDLTVSTEAACVSALQALRNALTTSTRCAFFGNYKKQLDIYSGRQFNCPISGDIAGIIARNDLLNAPWWAPAGYNRGGINNVIKLAQNFTLTNQGTLHNNQINLIVQDKKVGGFFLKSQKTLTARPSAFSDINVRRLFTYIENAITSAAKSFQWEFNDELTRSNLSAITNNFLTTVKSQRGVYDFKVVCDETNNTADIIDTNQLYLDVYVKPSKAITWITARFVATRTDANFDELTE